MARQTDDPFEAALDAAIAGTAGTDLGAFDSALDEAIGQHIGPLDRGQDEGPGMLQRAIELGAQVPALPALVGR